MKNFIDKSFRMALDTIEKMGKMKVIFSIIILIAVVVKFSVFYNLVNIMTNLVPIILISCLLTWLIFGSIKNKWIAVTIYFMISFIMFCDVTYFSFFNRYLSLNMLGAAEVIGDIGDSIKQVLKPVNFVMFMDVAILYAILIYNKFILKETHVLGSNSSDRISSSSDRISNSGGTSSIRNSISISKRYRKPLTALLIVALIVTNFPQNNLLTSVSNQEIYSFRVKDVLANTIGFGTDENIIVANGYAEQKDGPIFGAGAGRNLIVIQLESLQNFVVGLEYYGQEVTPNLNKLIGENSIYFDHYYQQTGSGNTSDAEFATNNSMLGVLKSYTYKIYQDNYFRGLPILLKEKGYQTAVFHAHESRGFWNREEAYPKMGFDSFYGGISNDTQNRPNGSYEMTEWMGWGLTDTEFYKQTIPLMEKLQEPFYSFVISISNHHPYEMLEKYDFIELQPEDQDTLAGNYLNSAAYTDYALGQFIEELKETGIYENSIIAIYGDHSGLVNNEETDQVMERILGKKYDFDEVMHIPMIINLPEEAVDIRQTISTAGGQLDFLPTMAYLMGFEKLDTIYQGQNLLTAESGFVAQHTFMVQGSFFLDDIAYEMSRDGIFENGRAWNTKTGKPVSLEGLREKHLRSLEISNTSQYFLDNNVLQKIYVEGQTLEEVLK